MCQDDNNALILIGLECLAFLLNSFVLYVVMMKLQYKLLFLLLEYNNLIK